MTTQITNFETAEAAFAVDRLGTIVSWNPAAEKMFGYPSSKALGKRCWELLCGRDTNNNKYCCKFCPLREMAFRHDPVHEFHASFKTGSADRKQYSINCLTIFDEPGNEQLLHICRQDEASQDEHEAEDIAPTSASAYNYRGDLSPREMEVLKLLSDGESTRKIAELLGIGYSTVRIHIQHVMVKLHVHKRREAVLMGRYLELI